VKASVIDLGYNSIKLVNYNIIQKNSHYRSYYDKSIRVKLGEDMHKTNLLRSDAMDRTIECLKYFSDIINIESIEHVISFATSAVREAQNKKIFLQKVEEQTGFKFKILSSEEEAFYSYVGALNSLCIPNCLFFDLGGGSLELVYTENYKIKKIVSLPLGSLKLTQKFFSNTTEKNNNNSGSIEKSYLNLQNYLLESLPSKKDLGIGIDSVTLVGVGGTLRALARYDQLIKEYPLKKLQNYDLQYNSLSIIRNHLLSMSTKEISTIDVIGSNRAETINTGVSVVYLLMSKLNFQNLIVSTNGIREGIMFDFVKSLKRNSTNSVLTSKTQSIKFDKSPLENCEKTSKSSTRLPIFINQLLSLEIINNYEYDILKKAILYLSKISNTVSYLSKFYFLLDEDIPNINHKQQVILALSLISICKPKIVSELMENYVSLLRPSSKKKNGKKIVEKISICLQLCKFLKKIKCVKIIEFNKEDRKMILSIMIHNEVKIHELLLKEILKRFESIFHLSIEYSFFQNAKDIRR
jgi:exopolyphosphatase / guanosine-5'-triphosphate,3'-diphosphate pyrophosphatase